MASLTALEEELAARQDDLATCKEMLALDPESTDALETIPILEEDIANITEKIASAKAKQHAASSVPPPPPPSDDAASKYDMNKHSKFRRQSPDAPPPPPDETQAAFHVGNVVMAKYSADKQWYQATIISKTGSSSDPVFSVTFKGYGNTETNKRKHEIRAVETPSTSANNKKRKADGSTVTTTTSTPTFEAPKAKPQNNAVISAAPSVDPGLVQRREPSMVGDGPTRLPPEPKKLKGNKALEKSQNSWNEWRQTGPKKGHLLGAKKIGKESQFRTADLPNAKVGFVGSGKPMKKDQARAKWNYGADDTLDE